MNQDAPSRLVPGEEGEPRLVAFQLTSPSDQKPNLLDERPQVPPAMSNPSTDPDRLEIRSTFLADDHQRPDDAYGRSVIAPPVREDVRSPIIPECHAAVPQPQSATRCDAQQPWRNHEDVVPPGNEETTKACHGQPSGPQGEGRSRSVQFQYALVSIDDLTGACDQPTQVQLPREARDPVQTDADADNWCTCDVPEVVVRPLPAMDGKKAFQGEPPRPQGGGLRREVTFHELQHDEVDSAHALSEFQPSPRCRPSEGETTSCATTQVFTGIGMRTTRGAAKDDYGIALRLIKLFVRPLEHPDIPAQRVTALLDGGANCTIIDEAIYRRFGLPITLNLCTMGTVQGRKSASSARVELEISATEEQWFPLHEGMTLRDMDFKGPTLHWDKFCQQEPAFHDVKVEAVSYEDIKLIVGAEAERLFAVKEGGRRVDSKGVFAYETLLGWTIGGRVPGHLGKLVNAVMAIPQAIPQDYIQLLRELTEQYKRMNDLDMVPRARTKLKEYSRQEVKDQEELDRTTRIVNGYVQVPMLWVKPRPVVPESYYMARRRLKELERRLHQLGQAVYEQYRGTIYDDVKKGYIRELAAEEVQNVMKKDHWFLPHFVVFHPDKPDRPRRVLDCAATVEGVSLNSLLRAGPNNLPGLVPNLHRFRGGRVAISADATEMFMQSWVAPEDEAMLCILWREENDLEPRVFSYNRHVFGAKDSPAIAVHSLRFAVAQTRPDLLETVEKNVYMDDLLASCDTVDEAVALGQGIRDALAPYHFRMVKWASNSKVVLSHFDPSELAPPFKNVAEDKALLLPVAKALGMRWDAESDSFRFSYRPSDKKATTAAEVLSQLASVFDALQIAGPHIMAGKLFLQALQMQRDFNWANPLTPKQESWWTQWYGDLKVIAQLTIPRWYGWRRKDPVSLHTFADASTAGYGAVMYLVNHSSSLVAYVQAKSRVANKRKQQTIPRLELQALLLGCRMVDAYLAAVEGGYTNVTALWFWTDSSTVWHWSHNDSRRYKEFVRHRLDEIKETLEKFPDLQPQIRWVGTQENPADHISRGSESGEHLHQIWEFWTQGPSFLRQPEENWPKSPAQGGTEDPSELSKLYAFATIGPRSEYHYQSFEEFRKAFGYQSTAEAEQELAVQAQKEQLSPSELADLRKLQRQGEAEDPPCYLVKEFRQGRLKGLACFMDEDGLVRAATRLQNAKFLSFEEKNPIVLPSKCAATNMLIKGYHHQADHAGARTTAAIMSKKYVVPISHVKKVVRNCTECRAKQPLPMKIPMAALHQDRLHWGHVFSYTGMDFFGPFRLAQGQKIFGLLFTCLSTRAMHLEATSKVTVKEWALAVERFVARRGKPRRITCDRAATFIGGAKKIQRAILQELTDQFGRELAEQLSSKLGIEFNFIPAYSPHFNGATERLVREVKAYLLRACDSVARLSTSAFLTFLAKAENIINQRPLAIQENGRVITPASVLAPSTSTGYGFPIESSLSRVLGQQSQALDYFWRHWVEAYLKRLSLPAAMQTRGTAIREGDRVLTHWEKPGSAFKGVRQLTPVTVIKKGTGPDGLPRRWIIQGPDGTQREVAWNQLYVGEVEALGRPSIPPRISKPMRREDVKDVDGAGGAPGNGLKPPQANQDMPPGL